MAKSRRITEGKKAADAYNKIPPPRMAKGNKPVPIKNSYSPRMLKPTKRG